MAKTHYSDGQSVSINGIPTNAFVRYKKRRLERLHLTSRFLRHLTVCSGFNNKLAIPTDPSVFMKLGQIKGSLVPVTLTNQVIDPSIIRPVLMEVSCLYFEDG